MGYLPSLDVLASIDPDIKASFDEARRKLRWWKTEVMMRGLEAPTDLAAANSCSWCQGSGLAHFCIRPDKHGGVAEDECFHPNQEEVKKLEALQTGLMKLLLVKLLKKNMPELTMPLPKDFKVEPREESPGVRAARYGSAKVKYPDIVMAPCARCGDVTCEGCHDGK